MGNGCATACTNSSFTIEKDSGFTLKEEITTPTFNLSNLETFSHTAKEYDEGISPISIPLPTTAPSTLQTPEIHSYNDRSLVTPSSLKTPESKSRMNNSHISVNHNITLNSYEEVIHESELLKYKPGMKDNFVERFCTITSEKFQVYKNKISSLYGEKALYEVNLKELSGVYL
jgi:hypothetical protein